MKILAVDDDPFIVELIPKIAARIGFSDVATAMSGEEALAAIAGTDSPFDCLLLDASMPGKDGTRLCTHIRSIPAYRKVPILVLTAPGAETVIDRAFRAGATDYVTKPIDSIELDAKMRAAQAIAGAQGDVARMINMKCADRIEGRLFDLAEGEMIGGATGLIEYSALKMETLQQSRPGLMSSQVVAVKIVQFDSIFARATCEEFLYALSETADAVIDVLKPYGCTLAYAGSGIFVAVLKKRELESSISVESEIQYLIDQRNLEHDNGDPLDINISIGNPIRPTLTRIHRIPKTFGRAIARAESRAARKLLETRPPSVRAVG